MRGLIVASLSVVVAAMFALVASAPVAHADGCPDGETAVTSPTGGTICLTVSDPGRGAGNENGESGGDSGGAMCHNAVGVSIPCVVEGATWFGSHQCYATPMAPQPGPGSGFWNGHKPSGGQIWVCIQVFGSSGAVGGTFFVAAGSAPVVDPAVLAERAAKQMTLAAPRIGMAPKPPAYTYVGLDTWLWIDPAQWKPMTMSATAGPTSVRVTASPVRVLWDMGESSTSCAGPGHPWVKGMTDAATTDCSYAYSHTSDAQPDKQFPVSVLIVYRVDWRCSGICTTRAGSLGEVDSQAAHAVEKVSERQTVVTGVS